MGKLLVDVKKELIGKELTFVELTKLMDTYGYYTLDSDWDVREEENCIYTPYQEEQQVIAIKFTILDEDEEYEGEQTFRLKVDEIVQTAKSIEELREELVGNEYKFATLDKLMQSYFYYSIGYDDIVDEIKKDGYVTYTSQETHTAEITIYFDIMIDGGEDEAPECFILKVTKVEYC